MSDIVLPTHEALLKLCAAAAPQPLYPKAYAQTSGVPRDSLDAPLNELRIAGLIKLTEWEKGRGQGYVLTELGEEVLKNPVLLAQLRAGQQPTLARSEGDSEPPPAAKAPTTYERGEAARAALYEPEPPRVMPVLLLVNLLAFGASFVVAIRANVPINQFISRGDATVLHEVGALRALDLAHGEWWRLISSAFLHHHLLHLILNMYCLYALGLLESLWGPPRFLLIYVLSAVGGGCAAMLYSPTEGTLAGASGAIWGLMTSLAAWVFMNRRHLPPEEVSRWISRFGILFLINVGVSFLPGISASAHFGGGITGFIVATLLHVHRIAPAPRRTAAALLIALLPVLAVGAVAESIDKDPRWQRLREAEQQQQKRKAVQNFKHEVVLAIDRADDAVEAMLTEVYVLTGNKPEVRRAERVRALREHLKEAREAVKNALDKLQDRPKDDERLERAYDAGKEYMLAVSELLTRADEILEKKTSWEKEERITIESKLRKARGNWMAARNQL